MAKNRSMAIKHAKAKKCAMQEIMDNAKNEMCCKTIPNNVHVYDNFYDTSRNNVFYTTFAIQRRIDVLTGRHYPIEEFRKNWGDVYEYLITHTVPEAREYFGKINLLSCQTREEWG